MENNLDEEFDFVIIGTGAAGLAAGQYGARSGLKTLALDATVPGGQILTIPRLENYPGVFPSVNGFELIQKMQEQAKSFGVVFRQAEILSIDKIGSMFSISLGDRKIKAKAVLIATGAFHRHLGVPGEKELEGKGVSYCATCDGPFFRNRTIVVAGGGDSACDEAVYLATLTDKVILVHRRDQLRAQKAVQDRLLSNKNIQVKFNSSITKINGQQKVTSVTLKDTVTGNLSELDCDAVFVFTGMEPKTDLVPMLKKDEGGYIMTDEKMETSIAGLYAAGDVRSKPFRQVVTAVSDGAIAAFEAADYIRKNFQH